MLLGLMAASAIGTAQAQTKADMECADNQVKVVSALALSQGGNGVVDCKDKPTSTSVETHTTRASQRDMAGEVSHVLLLADASWVSGAVPVRSPSVAVDGKGNFMHSPAVVLDAGAMHSDVRGNGTNLRITVGNEDVAGWVKLGRTTLQEDIAVSGAKKLWDFTVAGTYAKTNQSARTTFSEAPEGLKLDASQFSATGSYDVPSSSVGLQPFATYFQWNADSAVFSNFNRTTQSTRVVDDSTSTRTYLDTTATPMQTGVHWWRYKGVELGTSFNLSPNLRATLGAWRNDSINGRKGFIDALLEGKNKYGVSSAGFAWNQENNRFLFQHTVPLSKESSLTVSYQNRLMGVLRESNGIESIEKKRENYFGVNFSWTWGGSDWQPNPKGAFATVQNEHTRYTNDMDGVFARNTRVKTVEVGNSNTTSVLQSEVLKDQPWTASITGPSTVVAWPTVILNISASDWDWIASWTLTSQRKRNSWVIDPAVSEGGWSGNPPTSFTSNSLTGATGNQYTYTLSITDQKWNITTSTFVVTLN